jgi:predicted DCC family thiol-disulfide oxidoreductase YuxK
MAGPATSAPRPGGAPAAFERLVLFDGVCGFCDRLVGFLIARDGAARLRFAPLQGETAAALRARHPEIPVDLETLVYVEASGGGEHVHLRSEAALRIFGELAGGWRRLRWLLVLPRPLRDAGYRLFARFRYRLFGRLAECRLPSPDERARLLP